MSMRKNGAAHVAKKITAAELQEEMRKKAALEASKTVVKEPTK